jgi:acyl dehydratase
VRFEHAWSDRDAILYALSVGARTETDLALLYEGAAGFRTAPTFALAPMAGLVMPMVAELGLELGSLLHAGQSLEVHRELPVSGSAPVERRVAEVIDKGRAAILKCHDTVGDYATGVSTWWIAEPGAAARLANRVEAPAEQPAAAAPTGAEAARAAGVTPAAVPARAADFRAVFATTAEQSALHRLVGDRNPVHIDPALSASTGQPRPFLHGLCTFGALGLALQRARGRRLERLEARFTAPVFPGEAIDFEGWDDLTLARASVAGRTVMAPVTAAFAA